MEENYQLVNNIFGLYESLQCIKRLSDGAVIPFDPDNRDFIEYQQWLDNGNQPLPVPETEQPESNKELF